VVVVLDLGSGLNDDELKMTNLMKMISDFRILFMEIFLFCL
jgi:hypothetical protein